MLVLSEADISNLKSSLTYVTSSFTVSWYAEDPASLGLPLFIKFYTNDLMLLNRAVNGPDYVGAYDDFLLVCGILLSY